MNSIDRTAAPDPTATNAAFPRLMDFLSTPRTLPTTPKSIGVERARNTPSDRRPRAEAWPAIMRGAITRHVSMPFEWGAADCSFVFDIIRDMTGFDAIESIRGYTNEAGAFKALKRAGYDTVLELIEANFVEIPPGLALRGDIGYPAEIPHVLMSPAVIDGANAFSKHPAGGIVIPRALITRAWAV